MYEMFRCFVMVGSCKQLMHLNILRVLHWWSNLGPISVDVLCAVVAAHYVELEFTIMNRAPTRAFS